MKKILLTFSVLVLIGWGAITQAAVLTFDDLSPERRGSIGTDYGGFAWDHFDYMNGEELSATGNTSVSVSGNYVAFTRNGKIIRADGGLFNFNGAYLSSASSEDLTVTVKGYVNGVEKFTQSVVVDSKAPTWCAFKFTQIDTLAFETPLERVNGAYTLAGSGFAMDNFSYDDFGQGEGADSRIFLMFGIAGLGLAFRKRLTSPD